MSEPRYWYWIVDMGRPSERIVAVPDGERPPSPFSWGIFASEEEAKRMLGYAKKASANPDPAVRELARYIVDKLEEEE